MIDREASSAQGIGFFGVSTDKDSERIPEGVAGDLATDFGYAGDHEATV